MKYIVKIICIPCSIYSILFLISKLFIFVGGLKWGLFSAVFGLIGISLQIPNSWFDLLIMGYKFEWIILIIGFSYSFYWIYDKLN